jgi:nucleotide-binding universal stress UspA family protein
MYQRILLCLDNTDIGQHLFGEGIALAKLTGATLKLLNVIEPFELEQLHSIRMTDLLGVDPAKILNDCRVMQEEGEKRLSIFGDRAAAAKISAETMQSVGDPGRTICEVARQWEADLIIVGRRGRSGLTEIVLGSVSNYVLHHAPCSVLTIQSPVRADSEAPETPPQIVPN